ncbi:transferrin-a isoform 1-T1 [Synchiropus picturatus]
MKSLVIVALLGSFAAVFADPPKLKWCVKSEPEYQKCLAFAAVATGFSCEKRSSTIDCINDISKGLADAITLDGGDIYTAGLKNYNLHPIIAEDYGSSSASCYYAVAVVKKDSGFKFSQLQGKKSCHTGFGKSAGWNIPVGTLLSMGILTWGGVEESTLEEAVGNFFEASCAPGASVDNLCQLCKNNCTRSHREPYYDYEGAFKCLEDGAGDVAFVKHLTVPDDKKAEYELLCTDDTRRPIDDYERCHLARVPAHAVVTRKDDQLAQRIWTGLQPALTSTEFSLFSSAKYHSKNLMFKDSTVKLVRLPTITDSLLYLGARYVSIVRSLSKDTNVGTASSAIKWCVVGEAEFNKCSLWRLEDNNIDCHRANSVKDCLNLIVHSVADAMAVDGGEVFTAGKCGLVPAMAEEYKEALCNNPAGSFSSYYAVAVVKKDSGVTWNNLKGKRSCHTGLGRTAGWNIPMGEIHKQTNDCDFTKFFSGGCAPGSVPGSHFCSQCVGSGRAVGDPYKCQGNSHERYYGYAGAFRCLAEGAGDVAFVKHSTVQDVTGSGRPNWAGNLRAEDFELICPGKGPVPITDFASCYLANVPAHAVVTRPDIRNRVVQVLRNTLQDSDFKLFSSDGGENLLFKDSTKCLREIPAGTTYQQFLGDQYMNAMNSLRKCTDSASDLEEACSFHTCQQGN